MRKIPYSPLFSMMFYVYFLDPGNPGKEHAYNTYNQRTPDRGPETIYLQAEVERAGEGCRDYEHQGINDKGKETECEYDQRKGEQHRERFQECIHYPENYADYDHLPPCTAECDPINNLYCGSNREGIDHDPEYQIRHASILTENEDFSIRSLYSLFLSHC
jgi:hypothetical protein